MISVIICSAKRLLFNQVSESIRCTIGTEHEIIRIDNADRKYGICQAYNLGAEQAKYPFLCFVHEDVVFRTENWGQIMSQFLSDMPDAGMAGVAGSEYKSLMPSVWAQGLFNTDHINIIQHRDQNISLENNGTNDVFSEVKTLDGVLLFTRRSVWENKRFDEVTFDHFHCYDLDFSINVGLDYKLYVCQQVQLEHLSAGNLDSNWVKYSIRLSQKWGNVLPLGDIPTHQKREIEWRNRKIFFFRMRMTGYPISSVISNFLGWGFFRSFSFLKTCSFVYDLLNYKIRLTTVRPFY